MGLELGVNCRKSSDVFSSGLYLKGSLRCCKVGLKKHRKEPKETQL